MSRRGLTLLEVLAATVLLSIMAAACLPMMTGSMAALRDDRVMPDVNDLAQLADRFISDPSQFGFNDATALLEQEQFTIETRALMAEPAQQAPGDISVRVLRVEQFEEADHGWLIFQSADQAIPRWLALPKKRESQP